MLVSLVHQLCRMLKDQAEAFWPRTANCIQTFETSDNDPENLDVLRVPLCCATEVLEEVIRTGPALVPKLALRYAAAALTHSLLGQDFPYGTLMVNVVGSLVIGYLLVLLPEPENQVPIVRLLLITGVLGGFTTYSAFSIETLELLNEGHLTKAGANVLLTLVFCFLSVWLGYLMGKMLHGAP